MGACWQQSGKLYCKKGKSLLKGDAPPKLVRNLEGKFLRRVPSHPLEFLGEMGLVIIVVVKFIFEGVVGEPLRPFSDKTFENDRCPPIPWATIQRGD